MPVTRELRRTAWRLCFLPLVWCVMLAAAGYFPTRSLAGVPGLEAMAAAQALVLGVVYATLLPALRRMTGADGPGRLRIALKVAAIRLMLTLLPALGIAWRGSVDQAAFLVWVAIAYVVMIKVETLTLIYWCRKLESRK